MARNKDYIMALGQTVHELFEAGVKDPSATEIAEAYFPEKVLGGETIEGVRKRLSQIRDFLEENYPEFPVCLVSQTYYVRFRDNPPKTVADARKCLPVGHAVKKAGIRWQSGEDDLIWQEAIRLGFASGSGKVKKNADRALGAFEGKHLTEDDAARLLGEAQDRARPRKPEIAAKLLDALPVGSDDEIEE